MSEPEWKNRPYEYFRIRFVGNADDPGRHAAIDRSRIDPEVPEQFDVICDAIEDFYECDELKVKGFRHEIFFFPIEE